ncbi:MAG: hypothetical protein WBM96_14530 [Polyangiales bacterium]
MANFFRWWWLRLTEALVDDLSGSEDSHAARVDFYRSTGRARKAEESHLRALTLATNASEKRFLEKRLREVQLGALN